MENHDYYDSDRAWMTNRDKKRQPKQGKYWCYGCDANLIHDTKPCEVCGYRNGHRIKQHNKK